MTNAPERIWLDWPDANRGGIVYNEPPERDTQPGQTEYRRADLCQPKVKPLVWEENASGVWAGSPPAKLSDLVFWVFVQDGSYIHPYSGGKETHPTLEAAKAAAEAHYTAWALDLHKQLFEVTE